MRFRGTIPAFTVSALFASLIASPGWSQTAPATSAPVATAPSAATPQAPKQSSGGFSGPTSTISTDTTPAPATTTTQPASSSLLSIGQAPPPAPAPTGPVMTLDQVITQVLAQNPAVVQSRLSAQRSHAEIGEATGQGRPNVRIGASDTYSSAPTIGSTASEAPTVSPTGSIPIINDAAFNTLSTNSVSTSSSTLTGSSTSIGTGTSSTASSTTIVPVGATPSAGSVQTNTQPTGVISGGSTSSSPTGELRERAEPSDTTTPVTTTTGTTIITNNDEHVNNYGGTGSVTQIVDVFGLVRADANVAKESATVADLDVVRVENETALSAKSTFYAVQKAQSDVQTAQELLRNAQAILANAQIQYKAGASPQLDVISSQAQVASAQATLITSQNELDIERANLNNLLARSIDTPVNVAPAEPVTIPTDTPVAQEIGVAMQNRPEVKESVITIDIAHNLTRLAREGLLPSIGLTGSVNYEPVVSSSSTTSHYTGAVTASLSVPLYDGGITQSDVKAAKLSESTQRSIADQIKQDVTLEVKTALVNVIDAQALVTADQAAVTSYRAALKIAGISYREGAGTLLEVTNAEANVANAESNLNSATYQQETAYASLLRAEGRR